MSGDATGAKDRAAGGSEHGSKGHGSSEHLVKMANDIGRFFAAEPEREDAIAGIASHIAKFWTKRMREKLAAHVKHSGDAGLEELPREALRRLTAQQAATQKPSAQQSSR